jgi:endonuclease/exonuclease/phosphatase family metal-dependent hydrolase
LEVHGTFSKIDNILVHRTSLTNTRKLNTSSILSDHSGIKLEINAKETTENPQTHVD